MAELFPAKKRKKAKKAKKKKGDTIEFKYCGRSSTSSSSERKRSLADCPFLLSGRVLRRRQSLAAQFLQRVSRLTPVSLPS